jgi:hypothetical protein
VRERDVVAVDRQQDATVLRADEVAGRVEQQPAHRKPPAAVAFDREVERDEGTALGEQLAVKPVCGRPSRSSDWARVTGWSTERRVNSTLAASGVGSGRRSGQSRKTSPRIAAIAAASPATALTDRSRFRHQATSRRGGFSGVVGAAGLLTARRAS